MPHHAGGDVAAERPRGLEVLARTKAAPLAGQHERPYLRIIRHLADGGGQRAEQIGGHGVQAGGFAERQAAHGAIFGLRHPGHFALLARISGPPAMCHPWQATPTGPANTKKQQGNTMNDQFSNTQQIRKPAVTSKGGIVAAQSRKPAEVGAGVLAAGGDCIDAVIATTFALGVLEPWMSGLGGGGAMVLYRARENRYEVIDYGMRAPNRLRVEDYPLTAGAASDIFPWPRVKDDRNLHGPGSIAVPGVVAGME